MRLLEIVGFVVVGGLWAGLLWVLCRDVYLGMRAVKRGYPLMTSKQ